MARPEHPAVTPGSLDVVSPQSAATNSTHLRLLSVAVELFASKGFHGVGIRELASAAGLSTASLYHYMGTKERLLFQIMHDALQRLNTAADAISTSCADPRDRLAMLVRMHVVTHALQRDASVVVDDELRALERDDRSIIVEQRDTYERYWARTIADGVEAGVFTVPDQRAARLSLIEMCSAVARWFSIDGPQSISELAEIYVKLAANLVVLREDRDDPGTGTDLDIRQLVESVWTIAIPGARDHSSR
jgi:AcrR family transcriptional regulator